MEPCWYNRFAVTGVPCPKEGRWGKPTLLVGALMRWCDEHKHEDDVLCELTP